jgi:hypothetical protein
MPAIEYDAALAAKGRAEQCLRTEPVHHSGDPETLSASMKVDLRLLVGTGFDRHCEERRRGEDADPHVVLQIGSNSRCRAGW